MDEQEVIRRIARNDEQAFRELYESTSQRTYTYLLELVRDSRKAEDIMVDTYTEVWKCARKFRGESRLSTWIIGIARHLALKEFRRKKALRNNIDISSQVLSVPPVAAESLENKDLLNKAMEKISLAHKEILGLVFFQEMSYREISQVLNIPVSTVKTRVFYAKKKLKQLLDNMGISKDEI